MVDDDSKVGQNDSHWKHSMTDTIICVLLFVSTFILYLGS